MLLTKKKKPAGGEKKIFLVNWAEKRWVHYYIKILHSEGERIYHQLYKHVTKNGLAVFNLLPFINPLRALCGLPAEHRSHFQSCRYCNKDSADGSVTSERGRTKPRL